ncbi:MAG: hypothetical protein ACLKAL_11860 [Alkaliphilus sp.]
MSIGNLVVLGLVLVFLFSIAVGVLEHTVPFFDRLKFDNTVNDYLSIIQKTGGLTTAQRNELILKLEEIGFSNVIITAPVITDWGEEASLGVEACYIFSGLGINLFRSDNTLRASFFSSTIVMTLD